MGDICSMTPGQYWFYRDDTQVASISQEAEQEAIPEEDYAEAIKRLKRRMPKRDKFDLFEEIVPEIERMKENG